LLQNAHLPGLFSGALYRGPLKYICSPGLNCYSCPAALTSCPIGALQAVALNASLGLSLYVYGFIAAVGVLGGRFVCGWLCPFGFFQELLYRIPVAKIIPGRRLLALKWLKYGVLAVFVILIPTLAAQSGGIGLPAFCQFICPAGTLEAGLPAVALRPALRGILGALFALKLGILIFLFLLAMKLFRPFCRYLCPLGALYSFFNSVSVWRIHRQGTCSHCGHCASVCKLQTTPEQGECIRCGACVSDCPSRALTWQVGDAKAKRGRLERPL
jgi:polyferredoxin